jgi:excisionase family DNA binding protein
MALERQRSGPAKARVATDWLTLGQAAKHLGVAQSTVRKWCDDGRLPTFYTPGRHRRLRRSDLDAFVGGSATGAARRSAPVVLIVDDDERLREFVRVNLEMDGYAVREAASVDEGLAALEEEAPDLILLDVKMPKVDGWAMLRRVRENHGLDAIPVIMFSGKIDDRSAADAAERGAQAFIGKPFQPRNLVDSAKQLLRS